LRQHAAKVGMQLVDSTTAGIIIDFPIADIIIGDRHRKEMGNIEALARSRRSTFSCRSAAGGLVVA
jgi:hypothetical protein